MVEVTITLKAVVNTEGWNQEDFCDALESVLQHLGDWGDILPGEDTVDRWSFHVANVEHLEEENND